MRQDEIKPAPGSRKATKRVGRGYSSGHGGYSGRGCKGQKSRSSNSLPRGFEGGQIPLTKRLPRKRGFKNRFRLGYSVVEVNRLNIFEPGSVVTPEKLLEEKLVKDLEKPIKILAGRELKHSLTIVANRFSAAAKLQIEAVGGRMEELQNAAEAK